MLIQCQQTAQLYLLFVKCSAPIITVRIMYHVSADGKVCKKIAVRKPPYVLGISSNISQIRSPQHHKRLDDRSRSRSTHNAGTDTDDESFHEVYVTPVERGEFERPDLDGEEGLAF